MVAELILDQLQALPNYQSRWIVFIGDLVDRGPDSRGNTYLFLENADGFLELVADDDFVNLLAAGADKPHFLMLSACETAQRLKEDTHPSIQLCPVLLIWIPIITCSDLGGAS